MCTFHYHPSRPQFAIMGFWIQDLLFGKTGDLLFAPMVQ